jgi:prepilin-type N-terminal cleavage/methylation domain-containing protein
VRCLLLLDDCGGFSLLELLVATVLLTVAMAVGAEGLRRYRDAAALDRAAEAVRSRLAEARMLGVRHRAVVRLRITPAGALELRDPEGELVGATPLVGGVFDLDSARLRPSVLRFNARGQASPGSLYLYRKGRGVRVVSNFVGRVRMERFAVP